MLRYLSTLLLVAALSPAAAHATTLGESTKPSDVRAYRDTVIWNAWVEGASRYTLMVHTGGVTRPLPLTSARRIDATVGRGPDGRPLIVYAACPSRRCGLFGIEPDGSGRRLLARTTHRSSAASLPALWDDRLVWVESRARRPEQAVTAKIGGRPSVIQSYPGSVVYDLALLGSKFAVSVVANANDVFEEAQVRLQSLRAGRPRVIESVAVGEAGRLFIGLSFSKGALYYAKLCFGDASGCGGQGTAYRYRAGKRATASIPSELSGFAYFGTNAYWMSGNYGECLDEEGEEGVCLVEQTTLGFS